MQIMTSPRVRSGFAVVSVLVSLLPAARAQQWNLLSPPTTRYNHSAIFDPNSGQMIIYGGIHAQGVGFAGTVLNDPWRLVPTNSGEPRWLPVNAGGGPQPRQGHTAVYDPTPGIDRMTIFGGGLAFSSPCLNEVWVLANPTGVAGTPSWISLAPGGSAPSPRINHTAVFDSATNRMIVFGGQNCFSTSFSDVWVLVNANGLGGTPTWQQLNPTGPGPGSRSSSTAVYDPTTNRMIVHGGGVCGPNPCSDVWILTNANGLGGTPAWSQLSIAGTGPGPIVAHSAVFDPQTNNMIVFGGQGASSPLLANTWILSHANGLGGTPTWSQVMTSGLGPTPRQAHTAVFNPNVKQMIVFGGVITFDESLTDNNTFALIEPSGPIR